MLLTSVDKLLLHMLLLSTIFKNLSDGAKQTCHFKSRRNKKPLTFKYSDENYKCFRCKDRSTIVQTSHGFTKREVCELRCNGLWCADDSKCIKARERKLRLIENGKNPCKVGTRGSEDEEEEKTTHVPLVVGFAVGGIMLAVVIVGIFLGRSNKGTSSNDSVATTPVSMSYSEWVSNYSYGGRGSKQGNTLVQESGSMTEQTEDAQGLPVYNIVYGDSDAAFIDDYKEQYEEPTVIEIDDFSPFDESHHVSNYQCTDDHMTTAASPVYDGQDTVTIEYTSDAHFYDPFANPSSEVLARDLGTNSFASSANFPDDGWMHDRDVEVDNSVYVDRRHSWSSDGSRGDEKAFLRTSSNDDVSERGDGAERSTRSNERTPAGVNVANLKHVFVDVHRSMEELRRSQLVAASNSRTDTLDCIDDVTNQQRSFRTHANNSSNRVGNSFLISFNQSEHAGRRFSI